MNDFNMGILLYYNKELKRSCHFRNEFLCGENGQRISLKSPEECNDDPITEKTQIFHLGSILYYVLTGQRPYRLEHQLHNNTLPLTDDEIRRRIANGILPTLPDSIKNSNIPEINLLRKSYEKCSNKDPMKRPNVEEVANYLNSLYNDATKYEIATDT